MSLTQSDLQQIRTIVREEVRDEVSQQLRAEVPTIVRDEVGKQNEPIIGELEALRNDIEEIYNMIAELQKGSISDRQFKKLAVEEKILSTYKNLQITAKEAGVALPQKA